MRGRPFLPAALLLAGLLGAPAQAQTPASAPHRDPGRPPASAIEAAHAERERARAAGTPAPGIEAQAEARLRASFDAADKAHRGLLTREQAQAGGFGWISRHFDEIDTRHAGEVSFDDVRAYLGAHHARYIAPAASVPRAR